VAKRHDTPSARKQGGKFPDSDENGPAGAGDGFRVRLVFKPLIQLQE